MGEVFQETESANRLAACFPALEIALPAALQDEATQIARVLKVHVSIGSSSSSIPAERDPYTEPAEICDTTSSTTTLEPQPLAQDLPQQRTFATSSSYPRPAFLEEASAAAQAIIENNRPHKPPLTQILLKGMPLGASVDKLLEVAGKVVESKPVRTRPVRKRPAAAPGELAAPAEPAAPTELAAPAELAAPGEPVDPARLAAPGDPAPPAKRHKKNGPVVTGNIDGLADWMQPPASSVGKIYGK